MVHRPRDLLDALAAPGPDRRADEMDHRASLPAPRGPQPQFEVEVEVRSVDADESRRWFGQQSPREIPTDARDLDVVPQHLDVAPHRELVDRPVAAKALRGHPRPADPEGREARKASTERREQRRGEQVPGCFARDHGQRNAHRCRKRQRTMPRARGTEEGVEFAERTRRRGGSRFVGRGLRIDRVPGLLEGETAAIQRLVGGAQCGDRRRLEAATLQAFDVDAVRLGRVAADHHERGYVLPQHRADAGEGVLADPHELVHAGVAAEDRPVAHLRVTRELGLVREDGVAPDHAVVRDVHVRHDPVVAADPRDTAALDGAQVERAVLADHVVVADLETRGPRRRTSCPAARRRSR